ncbi:unnamed protein product [Rotaria sordida]|uniref:Uncharacterized protein n=3 Tax=Rotaria sordida TaxID=392033 RepID=A0A815T5H2_9BILA|nr:unnamed protein product [Rotaria sordida]CAF1499184.1 unnamed protein product [Rotaria sordida]
MGTYSPCPYLTSKQLSYICRRIVELFINLSLCEPDIFLQYVLDLPSVPILPLTYVNVNNCSTIETNSITTNDERIFNVLDYGSTLQEAQM